jgi:NADH dehydrogenase (ubiquinone) Fe-S protein 5
MASGFGAFGGRSRCYEHWSAFVHCAHDTQLEERCMALRDDYLECLHYGKLGARQQAVAAAAATLPRAKKSEQRPTDINESNLYPHLLAQMRK